MKKYSNYKKSDISWIDEIPTKWEDVDIRKVFRKNEIKNENLDENNLLTLSYGFIKRKSINTAGGLLPASFDSYQILNKGMIVLRMLDLQNDKNSLRVGYVSERGIITSAYIGLDPIIDCDTKYFYYLLHFMDLIKHFYNGGGGVRQSIGFTDFRRERVILPSILEQTCIINFLDYKTEKINRFIKKKKQLIKLLQEQKKALINNAITKGLDSNSETKDSDIEWLGKIPKHWKVWKFKYFTKILSGFSPEQIVFTNTGGIDYFKVEQLNNVNENYRLNTSFWMIDPKSVNKVHPNNILLIPKRGGAIGTNKIAISTKICVFDTNVMGLQFDENIVNIDFIAFWIKNRNLIEIADITTIPQINNKHINPLQIGLPNTLEQQKIVDFIRSETKTIDKTISTIEKEITLVEEYKTALIAEAVTGKIDARDFKLPKTETPLAMVAEEAINYKNSN
jgi:type I restriction enzyme S subunit